MMRRSTGEGSVYRRESDGKWIAALYVDRTDGTRRKKVVYAKTSGEAHAKLKELHGRADQGFRQPVTQQTVGEYLDYWVTDVAPARIRPSTAQGYRDIVRLYLKPGLGGHRLSELRLRHVQGWVDEAHKSGVSARRIQQSKQVLHRALNVALRTELVVVNAATGVELPRYIRKPITLWSPDQLKNFLAVASGHRWYGAFLLSAFCGLRRGEVLGLQWADVDLDEGVLHVRQQLQRLPGGGLQLVDLKTDAGARDVPLPLVVQDALRALGVEARDTSFVFRSEDGTPVDPKNYYKSFVALSQKGGLPRIALHHLRHGAATLIKDMGGTPKDTQELLGHAHITTTQQIYQHGNPDAQRAVVDRVAQTVLAGAGTSVGTRIDSSKGQGTEIDAVTSGGPGGARTLDTLLKSLAKCSGVDALTPVSRHLRARTRSLILGRVATGLGTSGSSRVAITAARSERQLYLAFERAVTSERLRTLSFPCSLVPTHDRSN